MRLFAAVVPPPDVLGHLELALSTVRAEDAGVKGPLRWTEPGDRHLTLAFYGDVPEGYLDELEHQLDAAAGATPPFEVALRGAGVFDGRTVWVGCAGATDRLARLMDAAQQIRTDLLGRPEDVRSRAHLTVARVRRRTRAGAGGPGPRPETSATSIAHALAVYHGPTWTVRDVVLMASDLGAGRGGAPRYDVVHRSLLAAVAG